MFLRGGGRGSWWFLHFHRLGDEMPWMAPKCQTEREPRQWVEPPERSRVGAWISRCVALLHEEKPERLNTIRMFRLSGLQSIDH